MGNESNSNSKSDSDSDSDEKKGPTLKDKIEAVVTGMGQGYFESQSKEDQQYQKEAAEAIGTAIGKWKYGWFQCLCQYFIILIILLKEI